MKAVFSFEASSVALSAPDRDLAEAMSAVFPRGRVEKDSSAELVGEVLRVGDGFELRAAEERRRFESVPDLLGGAEFVVVNELLARDPGRAHVHAAGAVGSHGAILALGPSGAGKSSLAFAWSMVGFPLLGDDVVRVDENARLLPFPRLLKVDPNRLLEAGVSPDTTPAWIAGSDEAWFDPESAGGWCAASDRIAIIAVIERDGRPGVRVRELPRSSGLKLLLESLMPAGANGSDSLERLAGLVESGRVLDVHFGSSAEAAEALMRLSSTPRDPETEVR